MKDVTSTSFGLLIAFVLPGVAALYVISFWSVTVNRWFGTFLTSQSNVGLFFLLGLASLIAGLQIAVLRWLLFEKWFPGVNPPLKSAEFSSLKDDKVLAAFRAAVDEHYRYHQFWGGMTIVIPGAALTAVMKSSEWQSAVLSAAALLAIETVTWLASRDSQQRYVVRARAILGGVR